MKKLLGVILFCLLGIAVYGQAKPTIAILPFTGGNAEEGDTIAELFSFDRTVTNTFTTIPRTSINSVIRQEQNFQMSSGYTEPETISRIGHQLGAKYILSGSITNIGEERILITYIMQIENLQQVAGEWLIYQNIEEISNKIWQISANIVASYRKDTSRLQKLAVLPFQTPAGDREADTLAQIFSAELVQYGIYAVYPRTKTIDQVQTEYRNQLNGDTDDKYAISIGRGDNPLLALSAAARSLGSNQKMFNIAIINVESGAQEKGETRNYRDTNDGFKAMRHLAALLSNIRYASEEYRVSTDQAFINAINAINQKRPGTYAIILTGNIQTDRDIKFIDNAWKVITIRGDERERTLILGSVEVPWEISLELERNLRLNARYSYNSISLNREGRLKMVAGVTITGMGVSVNNNSTFRMEGGTISGGCVWVGGMSTFVIEGGTISGNDGPGVVVSGNKGGYFQMLNGTISGNKDGGVTIFDSEFLMIGGTISGNSKNGSGGGVAIYSGTFEMRGGTISNNTASGSNSIDGTARGGGVDIGLNAIFIKTGGTIEANNRAPYPGTNVVGHVLYKYKRNSAAGPSVNLTTWREGSAGGWE